MKPIKIIVLFVLCTGCTNMVESGQKANSAMRRSIYNGATQVQRMVRYTPPPTTPQPPQVGYCYNTMSDIVCYEIPQPELTSKLVGYQGMPPMASPQLLPPPQEVEVLTSDQVMQGGNGRVTPFYIKEAPYVKADGEVTTSTRIMPVAPPPVAPQPLGAPAVSSAPTRLMPRY